MTFERASPSPNFHTTPTGGRLSLDIFNVHRPFCTVGLQRASLNKPGGEVENILRRHSYIGKHERKRDKETQRQQGCDTLCLEVPSLHLRDLDLWEEMIDHPSSP
ncbi:hypothetical protein TNCV_2975251 [Trichonephila clavipes]|nr:hypothetical protein TNCV_2975251 [Trichonephila clavipes]